uniref:Uncharacterized protein n=1 Tax=Ditylenchus dipsaci TaxID=166011 RepID=A0A915DBL2_9BILA
MLMNPRDGSRKAAQVESMDDRQLLNHGKHGYSTIENLKKDFVFDTGLDVELVAQRFGFSSFEVFVKSQQMENQIAEPVGQDRLAPLLGDMKFSAESVAFKKERCEREKFARAMLPENRGKVLEGRQLFAELVHICGGEDTPINYQQVRDAYTRKTGEELNRSVIKHYFQRDKFTQVIQNYCHNELELSAATAAADNTIFYLKLRKPYTEILESFANLQNNTRIHHRQLATTMDLDTFEETLRLNIAPVLPPINPDLFSTDQEFMLTLFWSPTRKRTSSSSAQD